MLLIITRYATARAMPQEDTLSVIDILGSRINGVTTLNFTRPLTTSDTSTDLQLTPEACLYFFFAKGGAFDRDSKTISQHDVTPIRQRVCLQCGGQYWSEVTSFLCLMH